MRDLNTLEFHPMSEQIVDTLCTMTQNNNPNFFRMLLSYYQAKMASTMRVKILTKDRGEIPINLYVVNLATSGHGKGHSTNIIEEHLIHLFRNRFYSETYPVIAEESLANLARKRAYVADMEEEEMFALVNKEFEDLGELAFSFDSGTPAAIKQMRHKLLMGDAGAISWEMDEIGNNLLGNKELLTAFLEMFDVGKIKQKLTKNTKENIRNKEIDGRTPANLLMFGTPSKLFDGAKIEEEFYSHLDTGYARRCLWGYSRVTKRNRENTAEEIYKQLTDPTVSQFLKDTAVNFAELADITNHNKIIIMGEAESILAIEYKMQCEDLADAMGEHQEIAKAEMSHRYFKALKLAGCYAFIDKNSSISEDNFYQAVHMVEESGKAFEFILARDRTYVKLAKYLGSMPHEVTHVEMSEDLPFYRGAASTKQELIQLAAAWGYKNQIVIKRSMVGGIEFIRGETLKSTNLERICLSYSEDIADGYQNVNVPWFDIHKLTQQPLMHWINHHSVNGHRSEENIAQGFNIVVLDVDGGATVKECQVLLKDYKYMIYTTKRHTAQSHRFRIVMPINYHLKLKPNEFTEFMKNIFEWIPIAVDTATCQRSRKWLTCPGQHHYNDGEKLLDARLFIPKTARNDERKAFIATFQTMTNMERWFLSKSDGNRNVQLSRYAFLMVDLGYDITNIRENVLELNNKLPDKLKESEVDRTIMVSAANKITKLANP